MKIFLNLCRCAVLTLTLAGVICADDGGAEQTPKVPPPAPAPCVTCSPTADQTSTTGEISGTSTTGELTLDEIVGILLSTMGISVF